MKKSYLFILILIVFLSSCDPVWYIYVRNSLNDNLNVEVSLIDLDKTIYNDYSELIQDTILYRNEVIENLKVNSIDSLDLKKVLRRVNDSTFIINIEPRSTTLIGPVFSFPVKKMNITNQRDSLTIEFRNKRKWNYYKKNGIIESRFSYDKITIINIKPVLFE
jgi:PBP1b-binding outer membrane lipoprotein LpoB